MQINGIARKFTYKKAEDISKETAFLFFDVETTVGQEREEITMVAYEVYHYNVGLTVERKLLVNKNKVDFNIDSDEILYFDSEKEIIDYFTKHIIKLAHIFRNLIVVSHNLHFDRVAVDFKKILDTMELKLFNIDRVFFMIFRTRYRNRTHTLIFNDNMNYYPLSIKVLGEAFKKEKLTVDSYNNPHEDIINYVFRDVEILRDSHLYVVKKVVEDLGQEKYFLTISSVSYALFHHYQTEDILYHINYEIAKLERASYRGGRNEARVLGIVDEKIYKLDVNSEYPAMMVMKKFPVALTYYADYDNNKYLQLLMDKKGKTHYYVKGRKIPFDELLEYAEKGDILFIAEITADIDDEVIGIRARLPDMKINFGEPVLEPKPEPVDPYTIQNTHLIFPKAQNIRIVITSPELLEFRDHINIRKVHRVAVYKSGNPFRKFVPKYYGERVLAKVEGDEAKNILYKLILNTLSGKFAQQKKLEKIIDTVDDPFPDKDFITYYDLSTGETYRKLFGKTFLVTKQEYGKSLTAISSFITSYGRIYITKLIKLVEENGGKVYYYDTDSLHVNEKGYEILKQHGYIAHKHELGKLKIEGVYDKGIYITNKQYALLKQKDRNTYILELTYAGIPLPHLLNYLSSKNLIYNTKNVKDYVDYYIHHRDFDFEIYVRNEDIEKMLHELIHPEMEYRVIAKTKETLNKTHENVIINVTRKLKREALHLKRKYIKKKENYYESEPLHISR